MIYAKPSTTFESTAAGFTSGLSGSVGVQITDGVGGVTTARTTSGIVETPGGSGIYVATLTAPAPTGQFQVVWDDGQSPKTWAVEDLTVTSSGTVSVASQVGEGMTFKELQTEFFARGFDYLNDDGAGLVRAKRWINQSYREICEMDDWPFLATTVVASTPLVIADLGTVESVINTTTKRAIGSIDPRTLREAFPDQSLTGAADYFYIDEGTTVKTFPANDDTLSIRYWRTVNELANDDDKPVIPARYQYAIIDFACGRAYMDSDNPDMAQRVRADADTLVQSMRERLLFQQHQDPFDQVVAYGYSTDFYP